MAETLLEIGYVSGVFGVAGEVKVYLYNPDSPMFYAAVGCYLGDAKGRLEESQLKVRRGAGKRIIGAFKTVGSRSDAEAIIGRKILVERDILPTLEPDEYYISDLEGLVVCQGERVLGSVAGVHSTGRGDMLEFHQGQEVHFVPLQDAYIEEVDIAGGQVRLTAEGAGLL